MFDGVILGLDPGLTRFGWGAISRAGNTPKFEACGVIRTPTEAQIGARLLELHDALEALIKELRPVTVGQEQVLFNVNVRTALATSQAAGIALLLCEKIGLPVATYAPSQVKSATTGFGAADKTHMRATITRIFGLSATPQTDAADALAIAFCHMTSSGIRSALKAVNTDQAERRTRAKLSGAIDQALKRENATLGRDRSA